MEKLTRYLILSLGMGTGAYLPMLFGADGLGGWSFIGSIFGGIAAVVFIYKLSNFS